MNLKSITTKLGLAVGACSLITIVSLVAFTTIKARDRAMESAKQHALAVAKDKAGQLQVEIETALDTSRTLADAFSAVKNPDSPLDMGRDPANAILQTVLTRNESFLAIYTLWEPEVFDQMDAAYAGLKGHDQTGRFIPYWTKSPDGTAVLKPLVGYETEGIGDYYLIPKKTKSEAVIDPHPSLFHKKDMDIISLVAPIVYNDEFFGIVGVDMSLDQLQKIVKKQRLYNGEAQISIISHNGAIAAASHHKAIVGKHMNAIHPDDLHDDYAIVKSGKEWVDIEGNTLLEVYTPLRIGNTKTPWSVNVMIPLELITAEATAGMWEDLSIGGGIALFAVLIIILFVSRFMRPLGHLTKSAEQVALGDLDYKDIETSNDEIGKVNKSFKHVVDSLKEITSVCEAVSVGDFSRSVNVRSEHDMLGKSINQMAENLRGVVNQAGEIAKGNYSIQVAPKSEQDELGNALFEMTRSLIDVTADNENQNWFKTGQTKLHERMRSEQDIGGLSRNIITFLSKYLGAQIGAIYIAGDDNYLRLAGSYAFTARKNVSNEFEIGRGLVGQAAFEKKSILLTNVPEDYVAVSSGLGEAAPRNIMVVPFLRDDEVMGVVELGSFDEFSDSHLKFLDLVSESIAIGVHSIQSRQQVEILLKQTQTQTEQLQVQQEELRQTNEELEEKTQHLEEQTQHLEEQQEKTEKRNKELNAAQKIIEEKAKELELSSKYKSEFLANMSHELRTPLNSILLLSRVLADNQDNELTEDHVESAQAIYSSGSDLLSLINDILDLSKVESGKMELHVEEVNLEDLAGSLERTFRPLAEDKKLSLTVEVVDGLPESIETDRQRMEQIVKNFFTNALKFTSKGSITLSIGRPDDASGFDPKRTVSFSVIDTGIGIAEDKQKQIFEAFQQADGTTSRKYGGTGLGLSIAKELAGFMGGKIRLKSREGGGSTFALYLPEEMEAGREQRA